MYKYNFSHGRSAFLNGLRLYNFKSTDIILIPDYLCEIVQITLRYLNLKILTYEIEDNFEVDFKSLNNKLKNKNVKAILFVNYFGFPQKIKKLKNICKKRDIILVEDNSHGFAGTIKKKLLGTRSDFGFASPRKVLRLYSGGTLYINKKVEFNLLKYQRNIKDILINNISKNYSLKTFIKKNFVLKKNLSNPHSKRDNIVHNTLIDDFSLEKLNSIKVKKEKFKRYKNYLIWKKFLKKRGLKPIFNKINKSLMIWCLPLYVKNSTEAKNWFNWGNKNGITIFPWPDLSFDHIKKKSKCFKRWERLICLPLDMPNKFLDKICN